MFNDRIGNNFIRVHTIYFFSFQEERISQSQQNTTAGNLCNWMLLQYES